MKLNLSREHHYICTCRFNPRIFSLFIKGEFLVVRLFLKKIIIKLTYINGARPFCFSKRITLVM